MVIGVKGCVRTYRHRTGVGRDDKRVFVCVSFSVVSRFLSLVCVNAALSLVCRLFLHGRFGCAMDDVKGCGVKPPMQYSEVVCQVFLYFVPIAT